MRKYLLLFLVVIVLVCGCTKAKNNYALEFKEEYESVNGKVSKSGKKHRILSIDKDNPFEKVDASKIVEMIENKETFYVYFGDKLCPWCRSVIEMSISVAKEKGIKKIYYVSIWDDDGKEILRDKYEIKDGSLVLASEGSEEYQSLLKYFDNVLSNYVLYDGEEKFEVGEKRIYAPNFIYVNEGESIRLEEGISDKQTDSREELTDEILKDEEKLFNEFFK